MYFLRNLTDEQQMRFLAASTATKKRGGKRSAEDFWFEGGTRG